MYEINLKKNKEKKSHKKIHTSVIGETRSPPLIFNSIILRTRSNLSVGIISVAPNVFNLAVSVTSACMITRLNRYSSCTIPSSPKYKTNVRISLKQRKN